MRWLYIIMSVLVKIVIVASTVSHIRFVMILNALPVLILTHQASQDVVYAVVAKMQIPHSSIAHIGGVQMTNQEYFIDSCKSCKYLFGKEGCTALHNGDDQCTYCTNKDNHDLCYCVKRANIRLKGCPYYEAAEK